MKRAISGIAVVVSVLLAAYSFMSSQQGIPLAGINQSNREFRIIDNGPLVVQFWASWCISCSKITPQLSEYLDSNGKDIPFIAVSTDDHFDDALRYVNQLPTTTRSTSVNFFHDYTKQLANKFEVNSVPTVILVNESGQVVFRQVGHFGGQAKKDVYNAIRSL